jgi:hypothetical protein
MNPKNPLNHKNKNYVFFHFLTHKNRQLVKIGPKKKTTEISNLRTQECVGHQGWWVTGSARGFIIIITRMQGPHISTHGSQGMALKGRRRGGAAANHELPNQACADTNYFI